MLRRHRFYVSLLLGGGRPGENLHLLGMSASDVPAGRGRPLVCACGAWTLSSGALAGGGRPEETFWRNLGALKEQVIRRELRLGASGAILPRGAVSELMRQRGR
jgi:hypothetical protein